MNTYDFVHLTLLALGGEVRGKTKLQKMVYFTGVLTGRLPELGYRPHYYGPYSSEVASAMDRLRGLGFMDTSIAGGGRVDTSGFEVARYDFTLNDDGRRVGEAKAAENPEVWKGIQSAVQQLRAAGKEDYVRLSIAAKTYFMLGEKPGTNSFEELTAMASKFGWNVSEEQVCDGARLLEKVGLVKLPTVRPA